MKLKILNYCFAVLALITIPSCSNDESIVDTPKSPQVKIQYLMYIKKFTVQQVLRVMERF